MPDAITLLLKISEYEVTAENQFLAQQIVHEVEHLPLALAHAGGYISVHHCLDTYLAMYQKSKAKLLASHPWSLLHDYQLSVATTIQMSLDRLSQAALDMMVVFSRLDATSIAQSIVTKAAKRQFMNVETDLPAEPLHAKTIQHAATLMSIFCPSGKWLEFEYNGIIETCQQYLLLQSSIQGGNKFHSMHRLVQMYLQVHFSGVQGHQPSQLVIRLLGSAITIGKDDEYLAFNRLLAPHLGLVELSDVVQAEDHHNFGMVWREQGNVSSMVIHFERCLALRIINSAIFDLCTLTLATTSIKHIGKHTSLGYMAKVSPNPFIQLKESSTFVPNAFSIYTCCFFHMCCTYTYHMSGDPA